MINNNMFVIFQTGSSRLYQHEQTGKKHITTPRLYILPVEFVGLGVPSVASVRAEWFRKAFTGQSGIA